MLVQTIIIYSVANTDVMNVHHGEVRPWSFRSSNSCSSTDLDSTANSRLLQCLIQGLKHSAVYLKRGQKKEVNG